MKKRKKKKSLPLEKKPWVNPEDLRSAEEIHREYLAAKQDFEQLLKEPPIFRLSKG